MNAYTVKKFKKTFTPLIMAAFLIAALFGLLYFSMDLNNGGAVLGCPFMDTPALCAIDPIGHIAEWQNMFAASFSKELSPSFILALLLFFFVFIFRNLLRSGTLIPIFTRGEYPPTRAPTTANPLQEAFSNGILHPKIF